MAAREATAPRRRGFNRELHTIIFALTVLALLAFGLVMAYSACFADAIEAGVSPFRYMRMQFLSIFVGVAVAVALWRLLPLRWLEGNLAYIIWVACLALVAITAVAGTETYGARRWLDLGFVEFQPSEVMKIAIVIMCAKILADYRRGELTLTYAVVMFLIAAGLPLAIILKGQNDLGTSMLCAVGILMVMLLGGVSWKVIVPILAVGVLVVIFAIAGTGFRSDRITAWLDPWSDPDGNGYQLIHSYYALSEGGLFGVGLGQSHEKFQYLPFAYNDFIFAVIGEELGLLGATAVALLFFALLVSGLVIAFSCTDDFGKMVAGAVVVMVVFEAFLNMGCVIGLLPITGKPLPFFSMGGTALLVTTASMGLVLAASRDWNGDDLYARRRGNLRLVREAR